jgi:hypothetical protein
MVDPARREPAEFMGMFGQAIAQWVLTSWPDSPFEHVILIFDTVLTGRRRDAFVWKVKVALKQTARRYSVYVKPVAADLNAQIADYFSWAWFRAIETGDQRAATDLVGVKWTKANLFGDQAS